MHVAQKVFFCFSGVVGSGLCIFSKYPITETFMHHYSVNGYAHCIGHGDWYGGKAVALAKVAINDMLINVYCTHVSTLCRSHSAVAPPCCNMTSVCLYITARLKGYNVFFSFTLTTQTAGGFPLSMRPTASHRRSSSASSSSSPVPAVILLF